MYMMWSKEKALKTSRENTRCISNILFDDVEKDSSFASISPKCLPLEDKCAFNYQIKENLSFDPPYNTKVSNNGNIFISALLQQNLLLFAMLKLRTSVYLICWTWLVKVLSNLCKNTMLRERMFLPDTAATYGKYPMNYASFSTYHTPP